MLIAHTGRGATVHSANARNEFHASRYAEKRNRDTHEITVAFTRPHCDKCNRGTSHVIGVTHPVGVCFNGHRFTYAPQ
jgi:NMD protein affecting ribosome stability and mRNA decay